MSAKHTRLLEALEERILVLDGAMGTSIQAVELSAEDFGGPSLEGCNEQLVLTRPDVISEIHHSFLQAGADIIETNTFGSTDLVLAEYNLQDQAQDITLRAAQLARDSADEFSTPDQPRFVAGSMGPTTKAISVTGGVTFEELIHTFRGQARCLIEGGVDYLLLETCQDTRNVKAGLLGIEEAFQELQQEIPIAISATVEATGTMLAGQGVEALVSSLDHCSLLYLGLNCATGPEFMTDHIRALAELAKTRVACVPNAGLPDEDGNYLETPQMVSTVLGRFIQEGWLNLAGGCCGTTPAYIQALATITEGHSPRPVPSYNRTFVSGIENLEIEESNRPILVGERTNVLGSRLFKRLIAEERLDEASDIGRRQVNSGAHVIDVCLQDPDRDEVADIHNFLSHLTKKIKVPLMIDSTDSKVMETALTYCQGKAILNSVNLEDGEERFQEVVPLCKKFGAALVVGTIDEDREQGMAVTRERKLEVARRSYDLLVNKYGVPATDIIYDPLVFPCATGDKNYQGSALETIEGVRLIKEALPLCKTILGVSNVSFGLPPSGREVLNSIFLHHCIQAGLDMAIVNSEKLERYPSIPDEEKKLAEALLFEPTQETIAAFADHFRDASSRIKKDVTKLPLDDRLANYIVEGSRDGLVEDLTLKLEEMTPLDIINGPLMTGMDEVGRLFNNNDLIVAEVLQSAEAMKAAVGHLEQFMDRTDSSKKGTIILATVKGDVHDIGKNLVDIILTNNGYQVNNLGIKVPPHDLLEAIRRYRPDVIGLSGLLVKSAQQMVVTVSELTQAGEHPPLMVGGAALTNSFTRLRIAPEYGGVVTYAKDAMEGLGLAAQLIDPAKRELLEKKLAKESERLSQRRRSQEKPKSTSTSRSDSVELLSEVPQAPNFERHVLKNINLDEVWGFLNPTMLYGKHMGLKGRVSQRLKEGDEKATKLKELFEELKADCRQDLMKAHAVWQFFPAESEGNRLSLFQHDNSKVITTFEFPRQARGQKLCLADYLRQKGSSDRDSICLFAVTAGEEIRKLAEQYKDQGLYLRSHAIQALAIETAEALAEWLHTKLRGQWGFPDPPDITIRERFQARYRGKRYSFGYPACPDLEDQRKLWNLIQPTDIGIELTEECMMDPEASVSAIVLHHPAAKYFSV